MSSSPAVTACLVFRKGLFTGVYRLDTWPWPACALGTYERQGSGVSRVFQASAPIIWCSNNNGGVADLMLLSLLRGE